MKTKPDQANKAAAAEMLARALEFEALAKAIGAARLQMMGGWPEETAESVAQANPGLRPTNRKRCGGRGQA